MAHIHRTVIDAGHACLYHYEKFRPDWLATTLRDQEIHCSDWESLNDPWDCRPFFKTDAFNDPDKREQFIQRFFQRDLPPPLAEIRVMLEPIARMPGGIDLLVERYRNILGQQMWGRKIYCLTPDPHSTIMWSHYTEHHKGICLEFGVDNDLFRWAAEVTYRQQYPEWFPDDLIGNRATEMLLTKSDD